MSPLDSPWLVIENRNEGGELVTLSAGGEKYALAFTEPERAALFLTGLPDASGLEIATLASYVLKEAYLTAARSVGATGVIFDYRRGAHRAQAAPLEQVSHHVRSRIGPTLN